MTQNQLIISRILKAVGLGMAVAVLALNIMNVLTVEASITMLSIGLLALALAVLQNS